MASARSSLAPVLRSVYARQLNAASTANMRPSLPSVHTRMASTATRHSEADDNFVRIVEVSPRDGLQNEKRIIPLETKVDLIRRLAGTGLKVIEAGAFVSPKWVPQMADSADVLTRLPSALSPDVHAQLSFPVLVPNAKGLSTLQSLLQQQVPSSHPLTDEVAVFTAASDAFTKANTNCTIDESLQRIQAVIAQAKGSFQVRAYISVVLGCPFSGKVDPALVARMTRKLLDMGAYEVSLGDTIGAGTPGAVRALLNALDQQGVQVGGQVDQHSGRRINGVAAHCHDTFGTGLANVLEFVRGGVRVVDASVSGLGGCPYSPGATGNIDTESVVRALHAEGYQTGVDLLELAKVGQWISDQVRGQGHATYDEAGSREDAGGPRAVNLNGSSAGRAVLAQEARRQQQQQEEAAQDQKAKL